MKERERMKFDRKKEKLEGKERIEREKWERTLKNQERIKTLKMKSER